MHRRGICTSLVVSLAIGGIVGACSSSSNVGDGKSTHGGKGGKKDGGPMLSMPDGGYIVVEAGTMGAVTITPSDPEIVVNPGQPPAPIQFSAHGAGGQAIEWRVSNPSLGSIDSTGLFTPSGGIGGEGDIEVTVDGKVVGKLHIVVRIAHEQNGGGVTAGDAGAGGLGGVGGEGFGAEVPPDVLKILKGKPAADQDLRWLYPYDETVFPLGILPPLFQWGGGSHADADAIYVHLSAAPYYDYKGYFGRPSALANGKPFSHHPIPKEVWAAATKSAAGSTLKVELVVAKGGKAYGPVAQSYKVALAPFNGIVYYQAYATAFVQNWSPEKTVWGDRFGGATLSIAVGAEGPSLVAGTTTDNHEGCRVCHSVSAYGDRMVVQHGGDYSATSSYDLKNGNAETPYADTGTLGWAGLSPDGQLGLANSVNVTGTESNRGDTKLYDMVTGNPVAAPGLSEFAKRIALPAFSPDSKHVAFTFVEGPSTPAIGNAALQLVSMDFDATTNTFSNPVKLWDPPNGNRPAFVTFVPSSDAVVFQKRWDGDNDYSSWHGAHSELWWVDLATQKAARLDRVNGIGADGKSYLPVGDRNHPNDTQLNYEPSISPVASGGYAWMVFMSRRMYGNVATRSPTESDPRDFDIHGDDPTTKKIWMAAIDLNAKPGTDPSHPAFYIPGQEIKGVNSRPFFALQPCVTDRGTCDTGVDCCSGFCRDGFCRPPPEHECSQRDEKCTTSADCCDSKDKCIGGFCAVFIQ